MTPKMAETLGMIVAEPGRWKCYCGQKGFDLRVAHALVDRGLVEWRREGGDPRCYATEAGIETEKGS